MKKIISESEKDSEIAALRAEIVSKRWGGEVLFDIKKLVSDETPESVDSLTSIIDLLTLQMGCSSLGNQWREINQKQVRKILIFALTTNLAYAVQLMLLTEAQ